MSQPSSEPVIREFLPGDAAHFRRLNEEWIRRYFKLEATDLQLFSDPEAAILAPGGRIFFAVLDGEVVGTCALLATGPGEFEVGKMAVSPACQGKGVGRKLLAAVIEAARQSGASRMWLETNHILTPAIHLYEALDFRHVAPAHPSPYARADVFMELELR
jgi:ribosomal protein S18 acetylase RimI-like enzyme